MTATARDYVVDEKGNMLSGSYDLRTWDEKWSFTRARKATTVVRDGVQSYKCPNCGSPLRITSIGECEYCHTKIVRHDFDWVLSEITQLD